MNYQLSYRWRHEDGSQMLVLAMADLLNDLGLKKCMWFAHPGLDALLFKVSRHD